MSCKFWLWFFFLYSSNQLAKYKYWEMTKMIPLLKKLANQEEDKQEHCDSAWEVHESALGRLLWERKDAALRLGVRKHLLQEMLHIWEPYLSFGPIRCNIPEPLEQYLTLSENFLSK